MAKRKVKIGDHMKWREGYAPEKIVAVNFKTRQFRFHQNATICHMDDFVWTALTVGSPVWMFSDEAHTIREKKQGWKTCECGQ